LTRILIFRKVRPRILLFKRTVYLSFDSPKKLALKKIAQEYSSLEILIWHLYMIHVRVPNDSSNAQEVVVRGAETRGVAVVAKSTEEENDEDQDLHNRKNSIISVLTKMS
jgi:hypothetical protein